MRPFPPQARGTILRSLTFLSLFLLLFSCALPPVASFYDTSTTQGRLELP